MGGQAQTFSTSYMTQKLFYIAFSGNLGNMFLRKIHFCVHPFEPKKAIFDLLRGCFWPKTWKKLCFQLIQSKISHFGTQMWPHKKLKILVPRTPPDPPLPPLTPPRGPGGPKMAKMHSLKSIDDNLCQKSHFWGVKKIDLFFHSEYTSGASSSSAGSGSSSHSISSEPCSFLTRTTELDAI